ncbi:MAG: metallophosphoesterase family protein [Longimicrobiales bacterium]
MIRIGLISDTHGLLRNSVFGAFDEVERILHAGDIGDVAILDQLALLAPVSAVYGNTDSAEIRGRVRERLALEIEGRHVLLTHGHELGVPRPAALRAAYPEADVIVFGHTHRRLEDRDGASLVVNPGAAGAARFRLEPSVALLELERSSTRVRFVDL